LIDSVNNALIHEVCSMFSETKLYIT